MSKFNALCISLYSTTLIFVFVFMFLPQLVIVHHVKMAVPVCPSLEAVFMCVSAGLTSKERIAKKVRNQIEL